jgi:hypothetical protein
LASKPDQPATPPGGGGVLSDVAWFGHAPGGRTVTGQSLTQPGQCRPRACAGKVAGDVNGRVGGAVDLFSFHIQFERSIPGTLAGDEICQDRE